MIYLVDHSPQEGISIGLARGFYGDTLYEDWIKLSDSHLDHEAVWDLLIRLNAYSKSERLNAYSNSERGIGVSVCPEVYRLATGGKIDNPLVEPYVHYLLSNKGNLIYRSFVDTTTLDILKSSDFVLNAAQDDYENLIKKGGQFDLILNHIKQQGSASDLELFMLSKGFRDQYSSMHGKDLERLISKTDVQVVYNNKYLASSCHKRSIIYRWILRGLSVEQSIRRFELGMSKAHGKYSRLRKPII